MEINKTNESIITQLYNNIPTKYYFFKKIEKEKFKGLASLILNHHQPQLTQFMEMNNYKDWKLLAIYLCCVLSERDLLFDLKDSMEDFNHFLNMACLSSNLPFSQELISLGANDWDDSLCCACMSGNKEIVELIIQNGKKKKIKN